ncbi:MAG: tol-pal system protein YbgF [Smithellaceae bacterium]|jgi:tol-pal system protein YbgF|nr:tol-pal system protein YbgF [Smithellaceae bacterium]
MLKRSSFFILPVMVFSLAACATSSDLKAVRTELNQQMEAKFADMDTRVDARVSALQKEQAKTAEDLSSLRKTQANTGANFSELRDQVQQLRGQIETLKKETSRDPKKDNEYQEKIDKLSLKINFIENFLEIGKKDSAADGDGSASGKEPTGKQGKASLYAAAYQTFKNGHYTKAREAFQDFLEKYPTGEYSDNAQFWIGECYFFEKQYDKAILEYEKVTKKFPSSNKVPYALLKQGISFQNLGDKISAKLLLQQVIKDYPNTSQARIARSKLAETK